jgi:threonine aldolase
MVDTLHDTGYRGFASDNYAGVHPEVLQALAAANGGHQIAYGDDDYTHRLRQLVAAEFGSAAEVYPVFNGTGANVVALTAALPRWGAVVTTATAHIHNDEGGAPERVSGLKLLVVASPDGKLTPELIATQAWGWGDEHRAQPLAVSLTQSTELGTLYTPAEFTSAAGVDVLTLGGTKNGLLGAEAIVVIDPDRVTGLRYLRKLSMQLASKMRFLSAQLVTLFEDDLGVRAASTANAMATRLRRALDEGVAAGEIAHLSFSQPTQANAVFAVLPNAAADRIRERVRFYDWDRAAGQVRWMCSWDITESDVDGFVTAIREELAREG